MKMILEYPHGPVFLQGRWKDIRFKAWHGKRSNDISLTAQAARRLACALLLEAEKLEASTFHGLAALPNTLARSVDRAIDAVVRFHRVDVRLRKRKWDRESRKYIRQLSQKEK